MLAVSVHVSAALIILDINNSPIFLNLKGTTFLIKSYTYIYTTTEQKLFLFFTFRRVCVVKIFTIYL